MLHCFQYSLALYNSFCKCVKCGTEIFAKSCSDVSLEKNQKLGCESIEILFIWNPSVLVKVLYSHRTYEINLSIYLYYLWICLSDCLSVYVCVYIYMKIYCNDLQATVKWLALNGKYKNLELPQYHEFWVSHLVFAYAIIPKN